MLFRIAMRGWPSHRKFVVLAKKEMPKFKVPTVVGPIIIYACHEPLGTSHSAAAAIATSEATFSLGSPN